MLQFQHTAYLFLLALVPVLAAVFIYARYKKRTAEKKIGDPQLVKLLTAGYDSKAYLVKFLLSVLVIIMLVLALANLRSPAGSEKISRNGIDVMIALDVSKSMLAQDIRPSRLERAKQVLNRLIDKLDNDRIGIVVFAGRAYLQMPLTGDHAATKMYLASATPETVPTQGTVIGDALKMCKVSFNEKEKKYKAVVLISDGEDHDENAINTAENMSKEGIVIYTVGIGSPEGAPIIDETTNMAKTDNQGNTVISKLNEEELRAIAQKANGKYQLFQNADAAAGAIAADLAGLDQRNVTDDALISYKSWSGYFLIAALLILVLELFISEKKKKYSFQHWIKPALLILLFFSSATLSAQTNNDNLSIKQGNDAYKKGDYKKATGAYEKVTKKDPGNATAQYNLGNAYYKDGQKEQAVRAYDQSISRLNKTPEKSNAYYNKGVVLQNDKKIQECITEYKNALKLDPGNEDARQNLQKALQQQKQQQQQKEEQKKDQKQQDKKKEDEQKKQPPNQQPKISKKDAEEKLKALLQQEKNLQDKLHKVNAASVNKPEKDW